MVDKIFFIVMRISCKVQRVSLTLFLSFNNKEVLIIDRDGRVVGGPYSVTSNTKMPILHHTTKVNTETINSQDRDFYFYAPYFIMTVDNPKAKVFLCETQQYFLSAWQSNDPQKKSTYNYVEQNSNSYRYHLPQFEPIPTPPVYTGTNPVNFIPQDTNTKSSFGNDPNPNFMEGLPDTNLVDGPFPLAGSLDLFALNSEQNFHGVFRHELVYPNLYNALEKDEDYIYHLRFSVSNLKEYRGLTVANPEATPLPTPNPAQYPDLTIGCAAASVDWDNKTILRQQGLYLKITNTSNTDPAKSLSPSCWAGAVYDVFIQPKVNGLDPIRVEYDVNCKPGQRKETISSLDGLQVWRIKADAIGTWTSEGSYDFVTNQNKLGWEHDVATNIEFNDPTSLYGLRLKVDTSQNPNEAYGFWKSPEISITPNKMYKMGFYVKSDNSNPEYVPTLEIGAYMETDGQEVISVIDGNTSIGNANIAPITTTSTPYIIYFYPIQKNVVKEDIKMRFKFALRWYNTDTNENEKTSTTLDFRNINYYSINCDNLIN